MIRKKIIRPCPTFLRIALARHTQPLIADMVRPPFLRVNKSPTFIRSYLSCSTDTPDLKP
jgi:hypothetical protein